MELQGRSSQQTSTSVLSTISASGTWCQTSSRYACLPAAYFLQSKLAGANIWRMVAVGLSGIAALHRLKCHCHAVQVRSTGPVNALTHQPIKGRKFGGGIRFGEMERDALLAHGSAYLLHDRLHTSSDYAVLDACQSCGSILTPITQPRETSGLGTHLTSTSGDPSHASALCTRGGSWLKRARLSSCLGAALA